VRARIETEIAAFSVVDLLPLMSAVADQLTGEAATAAPRC
jgi:hypothetical protein